MAWLESKKYQKFQLIGKNGVLTGEIGGFMPKTPPGIKEFSL
jgi:hypothetical protein